MTDRFPLLRLPQDALKSVLRSMELLDLILFSFSSDRAKSLVASINMKSKVIAVVSDFFKLIVHVDRQQFQFQFYYHEVKNGVIPIKMGHPGIVYLAHFMNGEGKRYRVPKVMDIPSWFSHIKAIFNCSKISQLQFFRDVGNFDLDSIRDCMIQEDIHELVAATENSDEYNRKIMKTFRSMKYLYLSNETYRNGKPSGEVLIQNFSRFFIGADSIAPTTMKLDDILMMNSKYVVINFSKLTEKDANQLLKLWMRGNLKLERYALSFANGMNVDRVTVLKGIKFQEIPLKVKRFHEASEDPIEGGIDVIRKDGTRGTIKFWNGYMHFFVWHDYCIMNN